MSDRVMVMETGRSRRLARRRRVYHHPANAYVENFVTRHLEEKISSIRQSADI